MEAFIKSCAKPALFFTKANCHYCNKLQTSLEILEIPFEKVTVDEHNREALIALTNCKTVPQLFLGRDKVYIGGYIEFESLLRSEPNRLKGYVEPYGIDLDIPDRPSYYRQNNKPTFETTDDF